MWLIAQATCRHHCIAPALTLWQFFSVCHRYSVAALLMALNSACCVCDSQLLTAVINAWALAAIPLLLRSSHNVWIYFVTILGSLHCNLWAIGHSIGSDLIEHTECDSMSTHTAWWLLGTASPNVRYPTWHILSNVTGTKIPSIGKLPLLCVARGCCVCSAIVIAMSPTVFSIVWIFWSWMSLFRSAAKITRLPSTCHSKIACQIGYNEHLWWIGPVQLW